VTGPDGRVRVLMLVDSLLPGGAERFLVGLATHLPRERYEVCVCATRGESDPLVDVVRDAGVRYEVLGRRGRFDVSPFRRLRRLLREGDFDVLHAHKFGSNLWGSIVGRLARTPVVIAHEQTWSYEGKPLRRFLDGRVIARLADAFVAVSTRDQERMTSVEHVPPEKTVYIPNAFVPRDGEPVTGDLRAELGIQPDAPVVGTMCVLRTQKRLDVLIDAFALVLRDHADARLVIAGYGPLTETWKEHAAERGISDRVHWLGKRDDPETVLAGLDVAAMSSDFEGTPLFTFECMAARTPVVATDVGGLRDVFEAGTSALLVPRREPEALAEAIGELFADPDRRRAMADAAHARLGEFTVERAAERVGELYESLLERRGIRSAAVVAQAR
jgi:glycosyltransferase involved in cell wall biosynthesis